MRLLCIVYEILHFQNTKKIQIISTLMPYFVVYDAHFKVILCISCSKWKQKQPQTSVFDVVQILSGIAKTQIKALNFIHIQTEKTTEHWKKMDEIKTM